MIQLCVALVLIAVPQDSVSDPEMMQRRYSRKVLINSIAGFACTIGMGIFYVKGNDAYDDYTSSQSMSAAIEAWDRVKINDTARHVFAVGAAFFLARAVYYQIKRASVPRSKSVTPVIEMDFSSQPKIQIGLHKNL